MQVTSALNGIKVTVERLGVNQYRLADLNGQSVIISATGIMEVAAFASVEAEALEEDSRHEVDVWPEGDRS